jgi:hypothetical protein
MAGEDDRMSLFGNDRDSLRAAWREAWQRHQQQLPLEPLQAQLVDLMVAHPEYHPALGLAAGSGAGTVFDVGAAMHAAQDAPEGEAAANAFMHLSLHLALREQLSTNRPPGIRAEHARLARRHGEPHAAEHAMIEVLARTLWDSQRAGRAPDERAYLESLRRLP